MNRLIKAILNFADDRRLIFRRVDFRTGSISLWLIDLERGTPSRFTFEKTSDFSPLWSPDGTRIVFSSLRDGPPNLYQKVSSSAGNDEPLLKSLSLRFHSTGLGMDATLFMESSTPRLVGTCGSYRRTMLQNQFHSCRLILMNAGPSSLLTAVG